MDTRRVVRTRLRYTTSDRVHGPGNARHDSNSRFRVTPNQIKVGLAKVLLHYQLQGQGIRVGDRSKSTREDQRNNKTKISYDREGESREFGRRVLPIHQHQLKRERQSLRKDSSKGGNSKDEVQQGHEGRCGLLGRCVARDREGTSI